MGQTLLVQGLMGQTFNNQTLTGKYNFRHLAFTTDTSENITDIRNLWGSITFNGTGSYGFTGHAAVNGSAPVASNGFDASDDNQSCARKWPRANARDQVTQNLQTSNTFPQSFHRASELMTQRTRASR